MVQIAYKPFVVSMLRMHVHCGHAHNLSWFPLSQDQLRELQAFQIGVEKFSSQMTNLSSLAATADPSGQDTAGTKMADLVRRYERLKALAGERQGLLAGYLPSVQQYESSRGAWQDLLCGWEGEAEQLTPPLATPLAIQEQIEELKVHGMLRFSM